MSTLDNMATRAPLPASAYARTPFSRDALMLVSRDKALNMAFALLDRAQQEQTPEVAIAGAAILFAAFCKRVNMDPHEAHQLAMRLIANEPHHVKANVHAEAIRDFAGIRYAGDRRVSV